MRLNTIEIKNYKSLEDIKIDNLDQINIFIGRNNVGKSSIFAALSLLNAILQNADGNINYPAILTAQDPMRTLSMRLVFTAEEEDRNMFLGLLQIGQEETTRNRILSSPFFSRIEYNYRAFQNNPRDLHLNQMRIISEDGQWAEIFGPENVRLTNSNRHRATQLEDVVREVLQNNFRLNANYIDIWFAGVHYYNPELKPQDRLSLSYISLGNANGWLIAQAIEYLRLSFFFNPFRHSSGSGPTLSADSLTQDGSNLAQVLFTLHNNQRSIFDKIEKFVQTALLDVGLMHTFVGGNQTEIHFRSSEEAYPVRLPEMGGGIEQLLMIATVLFTTKSSNVIFLEEPESHLHPGAQRFLFDKLYESGRQIFISTHSPTFINTTHPKSRVYRVAILEGSTKISSVAKADSLNEVLNDIGVRNSDVLMSDAILFVEGSSDKQVLAAWGDILNMSLSEHNITIVEMGGGEYADRYAPTRSALLSEISQKSPVPHMFLIDRDHRQQSDVLALQQRLAGRVHILGARELENYLLVPHALLSALRLKCATDMRIMSQIDMTTEQIIDSLIQSAADGLYSQVLIKRIRTQLGGLPEGFLTRQAANEISAQASQRDFQNIVYERVKQHVSSYFSKREITKIVQEQKRSLESDWLNTIQRRLIAPGADIIESVFQHFGQRYNKTKDAERIARSMRSDDIPKEIYDLIQRIIGMTQRT